MPTHNETLRKIKQLMANQPAQPEPGPEPDWMQLVAGYQKEHKCNKFTAQMALLKTHPNSHRKYLQMHNPGKDFGEGGA